MSDPGAEDFQWPEVRDLRPAEAARLLDDIERLSREANKRADILKSRKAQAKQIVEVVREEYELAAIDFTTSSGHRVRYTPYDFDAYNVINEDEFKAWAETQSENYYDATPRLREGIFRDEMRRRDQDGEPLPPGVRKFTDRRLSRSAIKTTT